MTHKMASSFCKEAIEAAGDSTALSIDSLVYCCLKTEQKSVVIDVTYVSLLETSLHKSSNMAAHIGICNKHLPFPSEISLP